MKLIFSRKGFDSQYGGCASPIFPDGTIASLPIPVSEGGSTKFGDLRVGDIDLGKVVSELSRTKGRSRLTRSAAVHLDPDLDRHVMARPAGWRPAFGQIAAAQGHLTNQGVDRGDLFLFFGWFKRVEQRDGAWSYVRGAPNLHVLFGWLQIADVVSVRSNHEKRVAIGRYPWLAQHPHADEDWEPESENNTIYVAERKLRLAGMGSSFAGGGIFRRFQPALPLTREGYSRCHWRLPPWFMPSSRKPALSYHPGEKAWKQLDDAVHLRTVGKGQEFVLDCAHYPQSVQWAANLIEAGA